MEDTRWEGQNFSEVVAPQEEDEGQDTSNPFKCTQNLINNFFHVFTVQ